MNRRKFLRLLGGAGIATTINGCRVWPDEGLWNPCLVEPLPASLANHELLQRAWQDIDPTQYRDIHTHLIGTGDSDSGIWINPNMRSIWYPVQNVQFRFYLNASCTREGHNVDRHYVKRLHSLMQDFPKGARAVLLAFDHYHDDRGIPQRANTPFHTPVSYARKIARGNNDRFLWAASIHPYRHDAIEKLKNSIEQGASLIKWLPPAMNIDPSSEKCDEYYRILAQNNIPLLTHAGDEHAVDAGDLQKLANPLLLRRALDHGVKVIVAHCATMGSNTDLDKGPNGPQLENFRLFGRLMAEQKYEKNLFGDISAITQINRSQEALEYVLKHDEWHHRLLQGSDYPLPGVMPVFSPLTMVDRGYLDKDIAVFISEVRKYNPLLFDFLLKRYLNLKGKNFSSAVFEGARIIES